MKIFLKKYKIEEIWGNLKMENFLFSGSGLGVKEEDLAKEEAEGGEEEDEEMEVEMEEGEEGEADVMEDDSKPADINIKQEASEEKNSTELTIAE